MGGGGEVAAPVVRQNGIGLLLVMLLRGVQPRLLKRLHAAVPVLATVLLLLQPGAPTLVQHSSQVQSPGSGSESLQSEY